jgi:hypothetical protein
MVQYSWLVGRNRNSRIEQAQQQDWQKSRIHWSWLAVSGYLTDRYSERKENAAALDQRVSLKSAV